MKTHTQRDGEAVFAARIGLALRELDGLEAKTDVAAEVVRRLQDAKPATERSPRRWLALAAALLAIGVTAALLVRKNVERGPEEPAPVVAPQEPANPVGPWRLVYELPLDALQRSLRDNPREDLEQLLARSASSLQQRVAAVPGTGVQVTRGEATTFTVVFAEAAAGDVARVRALLENPGRLEMRMIADGDYSKDGVHFDLALEKQRVQRWLDDGGRDRVQRDPRRIDEYRGADKNVRWFVHRVWPSTERAGHWSVRYADIAPLAASTVAAYTDGEWNDGAIPADVQARPVEQRFLVEFVLVNLHEQHFGETDLEAASVGVTTDLGTAAVDYRLRDDKVAEYADFSEQYIGKCCAVIWNDEVRVAPRFESRIPGRGRISGLSPAEAGGIAAILGAPLPATPRLLRSEPGTPR